MSVVPRMTVLVGIAGQPRLPGVLTSDRASGRKRYGISSWTDLFGSYLGGPTAVCRVGTCAVRVQLVSPALPAV